MILRVYYYAVYSIQFNLVSSGLKLTKRFLLVIQVYKHVIGVTLTCIFVNNKSILHELIRKHEEI